MKIALVITDLDIGGAERCLVDLTIRLDRERFEPVVYCLGPRPEKEEASCVPPLEDAGVAVHCLGARSVWDFPACLKRLTHELRQQRPDLLQSFLFHANLVGRLAARRAGVAPVVAGIRVAERQARWHLWLDRLTRRLVDHHVCVSEDVARFTQERVGHARERISVIPNGIDLAAYPAAGKADLSGLGIPNYARVVLFVGRLTHQKGLDWLLETTPRWLSAVEDTHLLLVGSGPLRERLEAVTSELPCGDRIHMLGWRADVPELLAASQFLVLPSRWEGMPNVVLQAMASGKPVLATSAEGIDSLLGPTADRQTVGFGDTDAFVQSIESLLEEPDLAAHLGRQNAIRAAEEFSLDRMVRAYESLWTRLAQP